MKNNYMCRSVIFGLTLFTLNFLSSAVNGQVITFEQTYKSPKTQDGLDVLQTADGYIIAGVTTNNTANDYDIRVIKTNTHGDTIWTKIYAGPNVEFPASMLATGDGNYFILGYSQAPASDMNTYLLKIDPQGSVIWSKTYGGTGKDDGNEIIPTSDGNYMITGGSNNHAYLMKIDINGGVIWTQYYGAGGYQSARSVKECLDGGFILTGKTSNMEYGIDSILLVKTNSSGVAAWTQKYTGPNSYQGKYILANTDGTYTLCVDDSSAARDNDVRMMKVDATGNTILWNNSFGGTKKDICKMIQHTKDGGYILAGISRSFGWINPDMWVLKFNASGDTTWSRHYGSWYHEHCYAVRPTTDGGYVAIGHTEDASLITQIMMVKVDSLGYFEPTAVDEVTLNTTLDAYPNPTIDQIKIDMSGNDLSGAQLKISNALGQEVFSETIYTSTSTESRNVDLSGNEPGVYLLSIRSAKGLSVRKILLQ